MNLEGVGFGLDPIAKRKERGAFLAHALFPYLKEAIETAKAGKVTYNEEALEVGFAALDALSKEIEDSDWSEQEKLFVGGACSFVLHLRQGGQMSPKKLKIAFAFADVAVELFGQASEILGLDVDRHPE